MNKYMAAAASAVALAFVSAPAHAVVDLGTTDITGTDLDGTNDFYSQAVNFFAGANTLAVSGDGQYRIGFRFDYDTDGTGAGSTSTSNVSAANLLFQSVTLNGFAYSIDADQLGANLAAAPVYGPTPAYNLVEVVFSIVDRSRAAGFTGEVSATAVPEPATWAMMLLGFGLVGFGMRRRQDVTRRVNFSMA